MMKKFQFPCGCSFNQMSDSIKDYDGLPPLDFDFYNIPLNCTATLELISSGRTVGVFQLENNLGQAYSKRLQPENIDHIAALGAILRPGCLQCMSEDKSMTMHYIDRKNGIEDVKYINERVKKYLEDTYGIMVYQEQMIAIAKELAGYNPKQANALRKNCAKKDVSALFAMEDSFVEGCVKNGLSEEDGRKIFNEIKASGRYSFNRSHSYEYGYMTYISAYLKTHFPIHFYCAYMKNVKNTDELVELMAEASLFNIKFIGPSISNLYSKFNIQNGYIHFGLSEVKEIGQPEAEKLIQTIEEKEKELNKPAVDFTWYEFLTEVSPHLSSTTIKNLISVGFLDSTGITRTRQIKEYNGFSSLDTTVATRLIQEYYKKFTSLEELLSYLLELKEEVIVKKSVEQRPVLGKSFNKVQSLYKSLINPSTSFEDSTRFICDTEKTLLGRSVSKCKTTEKERFGNLKCLDFLRGRGNNNLAIVAEVVNINERLIQKGPNAGKLFANVRFMDTSGEIECPIFSKEWAEFKSSVVVGNVLLLRGRRNQDKTFKLEQVEIL